MKKIIRKLLFFLVVFSLYNCLNAQQVFLSVMSMPNFPGNAMYNQTYTFSVILHCDTSSSSYSGPVYIFFHTDNINMLYPDTFGMANQVTINPGEHDTVTITGVEFSDTSAFKLGGNVVVVWPVSGGGTQIITADTFYTNVEILGYNDLADMVQNKIHENIYPVPVIDKLFLPQNIAENSIEHVRIIDILGCTRILLKNYPKSISLAELENGFYFMEVMGKNNQIRIFKFIVSR